MQARKEYLRTVTTREEQEEHQTVSTLFPVGTFKVERRHPLIETAGIQVHVEQQADGAELYTAFFEVGLAGVELARLLDCISHRDFWKIAEPWFHISAMIADYRPFLEHVVHGRENSLAERFVPLHLGEDLREVLLQFLHTHAIAFIEALRADMEYIWPNVLVLGSIMYQLPNAEQLRLDEVSSELLQPTQLQAFLRLPEVQHLLRAFLVQYKQEHSRERGVQTLLTWLLNGKKGDQHTLDAVTDRFFTFMTNRRKQHAASKQPSPQELLLAFTNFAAEGEGIRTLLQWQMKQQQYELLEENGQGYFHKQPSLHEFDIRFPAFIIHPSAPERVAYEKEGFYLEFVRKPASNPGVFYYYPDLTTLELRGFPAAALQPVLQWRKTADGKRELVAGELEGTQEPQELLAATNALLGIHVLTYLNPQIHSVLPKEVTTQLELNGQVRTLKQKREPVQMTIEVLREHLRTQLEDSEVLGKLEILAAVL